MESGRCLNHPDLAPVALCVDCRAALCAACTTRVRGRNFCARCLATSAVPLAVPTPSGSLRRAGAAALVSLGAVVLFALFLGVALVAIELG